MTDEEFLDFWKAYPLKIARGAAKIALLRALKKTDMPTILTAIQTYIRCKPEDRAWCHASTWLNQERWADEWEPPATIKPEPIFRKFRDLAEAVSYCRERFPDKVQLVQKCRSLDELPIFVKVCPVDWRPGNIVTMRRA